MRCRPGDLAIVATSHSSYKPWLGMVVRVVELRTSHFGTVYWTYEGGRIRIGDWQAAGIEDHHLRPIRDPGEDAKDESHAWLPPVPSQEPSHA